MVWSSGLQPCQLPVPSLIPARSSSASLMMSNARRCTSSSLLRRSPCAGLTPVASAKVSEFVVSAPSHGHFPFDLVCLFHPHRPASLRRACLDRSRRRASSRTACRSASGSSSNRHPSPAGGWSRLVIGRIPLTCGRVGRAVLSTPVRPDTPTSRQSESPDGEQMAGRKPCRPRR